MKVLLSWLREFVEVREGAEEIARVMSLRGFAVEGLERVGASDVVIDFEVTGNRPDCMSIAGMAREIATAFQWPLNAGPDRSGSGGTGSSAVAQGAKAEPGITITLENPDLCPYYAGGIVEVTVGPSPDWMQARLKAGGVRPISNIVDVTNYVLLELGQPMHAFDAAKLEKNEIRVRTAHDGERLKTLDGQERALTNDMLVIADGVRPVGIAGVMGGSDSEVTSATRSIVLESAYFNPLSVRRTSRKLGLKTEASTRFERGTDRMLPGAALRRACVLLEQIGAGNPRATVIAGESDAPPRVLTLRRERVRAIIGVTVPDADVVRILASLGFELVSEGEGWTVTVPLRRVDVSREVDLIEEIARHHGFDQIPGRFPALLQASADVDPRITRARQLRAVMTGAGFSEANTFGFIAKAAAAPFAGEGELVAIANPLSENFGVLRPSVLPGLVSAVAYNRHREQRDIRLFEIGARFTRSAGERRAIAAAWAGATGGDHWGGGTRPVDFFDIKGVAERILFALNLQAGTEPAADAWLVPGRAAVLTHDNGTRIGHLGQLSPAIAEQHGLSPADSVYVVEVDLDAADAAAAIGTTAVEALPRFPSVARDISVLLDESLRAAQVRQTIRDAAPATLIRVREFDRYQGKGVPEGKVSLSLRLTFRSPDRTLTDAEVQRAMDDIMQTLRGKYGAIQR
jgi:phenylalanyl-tRNA synthetase beta chain